MISNCKLYRINKRISILLPVPSEPMLSYTCPAALRETKHTCPDSSGTTQDFFILFIDLKKRILPAEGTLAKIFFV